jgi:hypothetical protein
MNSENTRDTLLPFDTRYAETTCPIKEQAHPAENLDASAISDRSCDLFEGGLGI